VEERSEPSHLPPKSGYQPPSRGGPQRIPPEWKEGTKNEVGHWPLISGNLYFVSKKKYKEPDRVIGTRIL
jgi:hypothetical protein